MSTTAIAIDIDGYEIRGWTPADSRLPLVHSAVKRLVQEAGGPVDPDRECIAHWLSETICRTSVRTVGRILHRLVENGDQVARRINRRYYFDLPKQQRELFPATVGIAAISAPPRSRRGRSAASQMAAQPQVQATVEMPATIAPDAASDTARDTRQMHGEMHSGAPPRVPPDHGSSAASATEKSDPSRMSKSEKGRPAELMRPDSTTPEPGQVNHGDLALSTGFSNAGRPAGVRDVNRDPIEPVEMNDDRRPAPEWRCPQHPTRPPRPSDKEPGILHCTARDKDGFRGFCEHTSAEQAVAADGDAEDRGGHLESYRRRHGRLPWEETT